MALSTGRCYLRNSAAPEDLVPLTWDDGGAWGFELELKTAGSKKDGKQGWMVTGVFRRDRDGVPETMKLPVAKLVTRGGHIFANGMVARLAEGTSFDWLYHLRKTEGIPVPAADLDELLSTMLCVPGLPKLEVPKKLSTLVHTKNALPTQMSVAEFSPGDTKRISAKNMSSFAMKN